MPGPTTRARRAAEVPIPAEPGGSAREGGDIDGIYQVLDALQDLLLCWTGACTTCGRPLSNRRPRTFGAGIPVDGAGVAADTLLSRVTVFVLQEQPEEESPGAAVSPVTAELRARFPLVMEQMPRLGQDEKFRRSVRLLCTGFPRLASG